MQTLTATLKIDFEDGRFDERNATDFLATIVEQLAKYTVANKVVASINEGDRKLGHATWNENQNKLMAVTETELMETVDG